MRPTLLHQILADTVRRCPDRTAIDVPPGLQRRERRVVTYAELAHRSDALARVLGGAIAEPDAVVVTHLPRASEDLYIAQVAAMKAGAAFTCLDPAFPDGQVEAILADARPVVIVADDAGLARMRRLSGDLPLIDVTAAAHAAQAGGAPALEGPAWLSPESLAYIIYTSGTTGRPKGVMIEHRSIVNLVLGDRDTLGITPDDRIAQHSSPAYDSSIEETWFALATGATLVVMDDDAARLGPDLVEWLRRERITMFCPPPTLLRSTGCEDPSRELPHLRLLHPGGEALPQDVADRWAPGRRLMNDYGPTETTVTALRGLVEPGRPVSIGRPVPGLHAWVLGEQLEELPPGAQGELCLGGLGLARGYRNDPELTARKFVQHPRFGRIYRTGDLASRDAEGNVSCHGRIDAQVKIRGYRIELEAVEARLIECAGVRDAACTVQGEGAHTRLVAFVVPDAAAAPPSFDTLRGALRTVLPAHMVPAHFGFITALPRNTSGKLNRRALPLLDASAHHDTAQADRPRGALEATVAEAFRSSLDLKDGVSIHDDFFNGLGGDSLSAAVVISLLRHEPDTAALTVRDLYEARTVAALAAAARVRSPHTGHLPPHTGQAARSPWPSDHGGPPAPADLARPGVATVQQMLTLMAGLVLVAPLSYLAGFVLLPGLVARLGLAVTVLLAPVLYLATLLMYTAVTVVIAVAAKRLLIGVYSPMRVPVWGSFYVRNWIVQRCVRLVPWRFLEITELQNVILRALGARIGRRVHLHRGVNLTQGGWDLLRVGDDVTVGQDATLQIVELEDGHLRFGRVTLERGVTLAVRAGVGPDTRVGAEAALTPWSFLPARHVIPAGELWDGVPAAPAGRNPAPPLPDAGTHAMSAAQHAIAMMLGRAGLLLATTLPWQGLALAVAWVAGVDEGAALAWVVEPTASAQAVLLDAALVLAALPITLLSELVALRLMGRVRPGVIDRWSLTYVRVRLKTETLESAGRWLCGTLLWPLWLRGAGMTIGRDCEISTIIDTVPELVEIGSETFLADGIHLGGPHVSRGVVTLAPVKLDTRVFLGNHAVVGGGQHIPRDVLVGVCTVADDRRIRRGTSWFGHPPFELHNREPVACDRRLTHDPTWPRYVNRILWELFRFALPLVPVLIGFVWFELLAAAAAVVSWPVLMLGVVPALDLAVLALPPLLVLAAKWILLGRVRPGMHPLWSCWCSRWDFLYVAWDFCALPAVTLVEGSLALNAYLRAMGVRLGRHVALGPGFVHIADPDLLDFEDGSTVSCLNQAHTFEDRVLKMDYVKVRRGATVGHASLLLYGTDVGERTLVMPHSVVMKRERLQPERHYAGRPTCSIGSAER